MMRAARRALAALALLLSVAAPAAGAGPPPPPDPALARLRRLVAEELPAWTPAEVVDRCADFLRAVDPADRPSVRFFDLSELPRALLPVGTGALHFGCNSASAVPVVAVPRPVPGSDNRIFWIDLRWYRWSPRVWEAISGEDPYFREPLIPSGHPGLDFLRAQTGANAIVRAAWFLFYTYDTSQFLKVGEVRNDAAFYYQLLYGNVPALVEKTVTEQVPATEVRAVTVQTPYGPRTENREVAVTRAVTKTVKVPGYRAKIPRTAAEFEAFWKVDFATLAEFPVDRGAVVDETRSGVSYRNRMLWRVRTALGVYWRTFDVFRSVGDQDFVENPFPRQFDAGEHIYQDAKGAQFYYLTDGKGDRVEFGDPRVVQAPPGDKVLHTAGSCILCHDNGILGFRNEPEKLRDAGIKIQAYGYERAARHYQFFLSEGMDRLLAEDQDNYAAFVRNCNGMTPEASTREFIRLLHWYDRPVDRAQAAREIGTAPEKLAAAAALLGTKGRLAHLALDDVPIPRATWERGGYQEAFLLLLQYCERAGISPGD